MSSDDDSSDSGEFDEEQQENLVRNFEAEAKLITKNLLPKKSFEKYERVYNKFIEWQKANKTESFQEGILLVFFDELTKKLKPPTVWSRWSMLRTTLNLRHDVEIGGYANLKTLLKNFAKGYKPKKAKVFSWKNIETFLATADDSVYFCIKVILVIGVCGALRGNELVALECKDFEDTGTKFIIQIRDTKTDYPREFVIGPPFYDLIQKYIQLRPPDTDTKRFFLTYSKGKCVRQPMGKNKISEAPKTIALFLNLEDPALYTGHTFRRTGATLLSNSGAPLIDVMNLGGWKSDSVARGYIEKSVAMKEKNFRGIISARQVLSSKNETSATVVSRSPLVNKNVENFQDVNQNEIYESAVSLDPKVIVLENTHDKRENLNKKRKFSTDSSLNVENDRLSQMRPMQISNCEQFTMNINNYSCTHKET